MGKFKRIVGSIEDAAKDKELPKSTLVKTGCVLLDLACSDSIKGGFRAGGMVNIIGDSSSGKSFLALTILAEAIRSKQFDDYKLVYDDSEAAMRFNVKKLFGKKFADRIDKPTKGMSYTTSTFQANIMHMIKEHDPFIYILDSYDAIVADDELKKAQEENEGKSKTGSYGMGKAKFSSKIFRLIASGLESTNSLLVVISQTREDINPMTFTKKTRSGGKALKFYATHELWMAEKGKLRKGDYITGVNVLVKLGKNKLTGKIRTIQFPIHYSYGVDEITAAIDYLIDKKVWEMKGLKIKANEFKVEMTKTKLVKHIETGGLLLKLKKIVQAAWDKTESGLIVDRKPKFD